MGEEPPWSKALKRVLLLVEGQTEERFAKDVLTPWAAGLGLSLEVTILITKRVKDGPNFKGGATTYSKVRGDLDRLLRNRGPAMLTTLLDYYGLPEDTPGMGARLNHSSPFDRAACVEQAIRNDLKNPKLFVPFLALHEFEAWLFSCPNTLPEVLDDTRYAAKFASVCSLAESPEHINDQPDSAPSKRILALYPSYKKIVHGVAAANRIGLDLMRSKCQHLNDWLSGLEEFARS